MRPARGRRRLFALLCLLPLSLSAPSPDLDHDQVTFSSPSHHIESRTTLVDLLSSDPHHSILIRLLQRARLITTLNKLNGSTFFAPTNEAIHAASLSAPSNIWANALDERPPIDNIQSGLRATLLYHLLNFTLPYNTSVGPKNVEMYETLLFPHPNEGTGRPGDPPRHDDGGDEADLLAGEGQKVRLARIEDAIKVGVDGRGNGGVGIVGPERKATNGVLVSISGVLTPPKSIGA